MKTEYSYTVSRWNVGLWWVSHWCSSKSKREMGMCLVDLHILQPRTNLFLDAAR